MKILLLAGGDSSEREVSLATGEAVYDSLVKQGHKVFAVDPVTSKSLLTSDNKFVDYRNAEVKSLNNSTRTDVRSIANTIGSPGFHDIDVVFIALHGGSGENGTIQCLLELAGKKFTGSSMTASAVAMDKALSKRLFESENIQTPEWSVYRLRHDHVDDRLVSEITSRFHLPIIVKPNDSGSTVGLSKVDKHDQLRPALDKANAESSSILVEEFIPGREMTVAVLDGKAFPVVEIIPKNELYDYDAKYTIGKSQYFAPADIDKETAKELRDAAVKAFNVIGASGVVRVDFILASDGLIYCLELNTIPGMTSLSLVPMAASAAGIEFDELISMLVKSAQAS